MDGDEIFNRKATSADKEWTYVHGSLNGDLYGRWWLNPEQFEYLSSKLAAGNRVVYKVGYRKTGTTDKLGINVYSSHEDYTKSASLKGSAKAIKEFKSLCKF
ncbi:hypothetical protein [Endozoicomonas sp. ALB115]|uniref:hypothetical protein n=1 Tax=Endozoicomonas sp. ALB115 TaxID=3403074 RepID=UPI003BB5F83D